MKNLGGFKLELLQLDRLAEPSLKVTHQIHTGLRSLLLFLKVFTEPHLLHPLVVFHNERVDIPHVLGVLTGKIIIAQETALEAPLLRASPVPTVGFPYVQAGGALETREPLKSLPELLEAEGAYDLLHPVIAGRVYEPLQLPRCVLYPSVSVWALPTIDPTNTVVEFINGHTDYKILRS